MNMNWKEEYCYALALVPYAIDINTEELNLCDETLCQDCVFNQLSTCDSVVRTEYLIKHFDKIFTNETNKRRPVVGVGKDFYLSGCGDNISCENCLFDTADPKKCQAQARNFIWDNIKEELSSDF